MEESHFDLRDGVMDWGSSVLVYSGFLKVDTLGTRYRCFFLFISCFFITA